MRLQEGFASILELFDMLQHLAIPIVISSRGTDCDVVIHLGLSQQLRREQCMKGKTRGLDNVKLQTGRAIGEHDSVLSSQWQGHYSVHGTLITQSIRASISQVRPLHLANLHHALYISSLISYHQLQKARNTFLLMPRLHKPIPYPIIPLCRRHSPRQQ